MEPAAGEIVAIVGVAASGHADFVAVIKLRDAAQREGQGKGQLQFCGRASFGADETRDIMIGEKSDERIRARVKRIMAKHVGDFSPARREVERREERSTAGNRKGW